MLLAATPSLRLIPPSQVTGDRWLAEDPSVPRRFRLELPAVVALLGCLSSREEEAVVRDLDDRCSLDATSARGLLSALRVNGLLTDEATGTLPAARTFAEMTTSWQAKGWIEAAEYHAATYDYPFIDYAEGGRILDSGRMREYASREPDDNRYKAYPGASTIPLPTPNASLVRSSLLDALYREPTETVTRDSLLSLLSLTFGEIGRITSGRWQRQPMMRRTSPSGGARHPVEGYVVVLDVPGLEPGTYHVAPSLARLELVAPGRMEDAAVARLFPAEYHREPHLNAIVVMTCVFARNMYRYREPRTFRTVHNDAGHLASTAELVARGLGLRARVKYPGNDTEIEHHLGIDGLVEGFMLSVSLTPPDREVLPAEGTEGKDR